MRCAIRCQYDLHRTLVKSTHMVNQMKPSFSLIRVFSSTPVSGISAVTNETISTSFNKAANSPSNALNNILVALLLKRNPIILRKPHEVEVQYHLYAKQMHDLDRQIISPDFHTRKKRMIIPMEKPLEESEDTDKALKAGAAMDVDSDIAFQNRWTEDDGTITSHNDSTLSFRRDNENLKSLKRRLDQSLYLVWNSQTNSSKSITTAPREAKGSSDLSSEDIESKSASSGPLWALPVTNVLQNESLADAAMRLFKANNTRPCDITIIGTAPVGVYQNSKDTKVNRTFMVST